VFRRGTGFQPVNDGRLPDSTDLPLPPPPLPLVAAFGQAWSSPALAGRQAWLIHPRDLPPEGATLASGSRVWLAGVDTEGINHAWFPWIAAQPDAELRINPGSASDIRSLWPDVVLTQEN
jgi:hypothetical protein